MGKYIHSRKQVNRLPDDCFILRCVFSLTGTKIAGIKCICWLLSNNKSLLLCIPLELFMYHVPWYIVMWLGSVEHRCPLNHTFKIKVIWEQNHISGDSFSFLCQWLTVFPKCKKTRSTPDLFCDLLLNTPSFSWVLLSPLPEQGRQHLRALGTKSTCCVNLFGRKDKVGEERRRKEARRGCALTSQRRKSFMQNGANFSCSSARFSVSVPLRLESLVFEANIVPFLQYLLWKWKQWINGVILDKSVSWFLVLSIVTVCCFTLYSEARIT